MRPPAAIASCAAAAATLLTFTAPLHAITITWTGEQSTDFFDDANWTGDVVDGTAGRDLRFDDPSLVPNQPDMDGSSHGRVNNLIFEHAGWTISNGGQITMNLEGGGVSSSGAGANVLDASLKFFRTPGYNIQIATGNIFAVTGDTWNQGNSDLTITGGGTLVIATNTATGSDYNADTTITNATVLINTPTKIGARYTIGDGGVLGGTGGIQSRSNRNAAFNDGSTLAPGGNGDFGDAIGTMSWGAIQSDHRINLNDGSTLAIDFNTTEADLLSLINGTNATRLFINEGATLSLTGIANPGTSYIIVQNDDLSVTGRINGQFTHILLNGTLVDPLTNPAIDLLYGPNTITVTFNQSVIPEPATLTLAGLGSLLLIARRRR